MTHLEPSEPTETIHFQCEAPCATSVSLLGDFNNWNPSAHPMRREANGLWVIEISLTCCRHYYQFLVDGQPILDPEAMCTISRQRQSKVSLIALC